MAPAKPLKESQTKEVTLGFKSLFQGDHLGVEFALESHTVLLSEGGLLVPDETILGHHVPTWSAMARSGY